MTTPVRVLVVMLSAGAVALLSGCSRGVPSADLERVQAWIPAGAVRAYPLIGPDVLPRAVGARSVGGQREGLVPIGEPEIAGPSWWSWPAQGTRVTQAVLVKTAEGHFYRGTYVWRDDLIVDDCVKSPSPCARFDYMRALEVDEAKDLLRQARQFTPALFTQFFGTAPKSGTQV